MGRTPGARDKQPRKPRGSSTSSEGSGGEQQQSAQQSHPNMTEDVRKGVLMRNIGPLEELIRQHKKLGGKIGSERKRIMEAGGFEKYEIDHALKLRSDNEDTDGKAELEKQRRLNTIAAYVLHPIGTQPDLFDNVDRTPLAERAYNEGYNAGLEGKTRKPPHDPSTEAYAQWIRGWDDAQSFIIKKGIKRLDETDDAGQASLIPANRPDAAPTLSNAASNEQFDDALENEESGEEEGEEGEEDDDGGDQGEPPAPDGAPETTEPTKQASGDDLKIPAFLDRNNPENQRKFAAGGDEHIRQQIEGKTE